MTEPTTSPASPALGRGSRIVGEQRSRLSTEMAGRYADGESIRAIAADLGRSYGWVQMLLKEAGVELRARGGDTRSAVARAAAVPEPQTIPEPVEGPEPVVPTTPEPVEGKKSKKKDAGKKGSKKDSAKKSSGKRASKKDSQKKDAGKKK